jgi:hypothetical protein
MHSRSEWLDGMPSVPFLVACNMQSFASSVKPRELAAIRAILQAQANNPKE